VGHLDMVLYNKAENFHIVPYNGYFIVSVNENLWIFRTYSIGIGCEFF
jgi:hypothetical protein